MNIEQEKKLDENILLTKKLLIVLGGDEETKSIGAIERLDIVGKKNEELNKKVDKYINIGFGIILTFSVFITLLGLYFDSKVKANAQSNGNLPQAIYMTDDKWKEVQEFFKHIK
jgi:hypothetical protein